MMAAAGPLSQQALADPYEALAKYQFGQSREPLAAIDAEIRKTPVSGYKGIESRLLAVLKAADTTKDAKRYICRWLAVVGSAECVPAVAELLTDEDLSHPARMALEPLKHPAAGAALRAALPKVKGRLLAGVISSIGVRRDAEAVETLARLARDPDPMVAGAALSALGEIATDEAVRALEGIEPPQPLARVKARAKITAAGRLAAAGKRAEAVTVYGTLISHVHPQAVRIAAVKGIMSTARRDIAVREIFLFLSRPNEGDEVWMRAAAIAAYLDSTDKAMKDAVAEQLPTMNPDGQRALLLALADAPDVTARPSVLKVLNATSYADVRVAAVECLARHGEAADVPLVVRLAHAKRADVADAARKVLQRMGKPGVDEALARLIESPDAADRAVVLAVLADRRVEAALPILVRLLGGSDAAMAAEAAKGLGVLGKNEQLTALASVLVRPQSDSVRGAAEEAVKAICARSTDKRAAAKALLAAMDKAATPAARSTVLRLLAHTRGEQALSAVRKAIEDPNEEVRETAIRTLIAWPEAAAAPHLVELAKTAHKPAHAVLALRDGCLRLANLKEVPLAERLSIYRGVLDAAKRTEEKKLAIA
jgi:HEAT repeat protein